MEVGELGHSEYKYRQGILQKQEATHQLLPTALTVKDHEGKITNLPYADISAVHLAYIQTKYGSFIRCDVNTRTDQKARLISRHYKGFARFEDRKTTFIPFVKALHQQLERMPSANRKYTKGSLFTFLLSLVLVVVFLAVMAIGWFTQQWILLILMTIGFIRLGYSLVRSVPGQYDPKTLPTWMK